MSKLPELNTSITKTIIQGQMKEVIDEESYWKNPNSYSNNGCIIMDDIVLPIFDDPYIGNNRPGVYSGGYRNNTVEGYNGGCVRFVVQPSEKVKGLYKSEKTINISSKDDIKTILEKEETVSRLMEPWITNPDNITIFNITENDSPEMRALKEALNSKKMDFDKYAPRFGDNFANDKRQLKNNTVTLNIIKRFCDKCDMECELTLKDASNDVPNPIGREITVSLMSNDEQE